LHIRKDFYQCDSTIVLNETKHMSDLVARLSGYSVPRNKAIIGANAYAHESGIHQDGVLKNPETYEIITPQLVGVQTNSLPLGKLSGRHAFSTKMAELGYQLDEEQVKVLFKKFKDLADKKKQITDEDLMALQADEVRRTAGNYELKTVQLQYVSTGYQGAVVSIENQQQEIQTASAIGAGSIQAIYNSIDQIFDQQPQLVEYQITALTAGEDAQAEVHVSIENPETNERVNGIGVDFDVLQASAEAYTQASAKLKEKGQTA
jgi:Isopropylmalate/homocitrate/citramalate synthases